MRLCQEKAAYTDIHPEEVRAKVESGARLVDVRERWEYVEGHIPGTVNVPLTRLPGWIERVGPGEVVLVCASGNRSVAAAQTLAGYRSGVANLLGGTRGWVSRGLPVVAGDGPGALA